MLTFVLAKASCQDPFGGCCLSVASMQQSEMETTWCCGSGLHQPWGLSWIFLLSLRLMICCGSGNRAWEPRDGAGLNRDGHFVYSLILSVFDQDVIQERVWHRAKWQ